MVVEQGRSHAIPRIVDLTIEQAPKRFPPTLDSG